MVKGEEE